MGYLYQVRVEAVNDAYLTCRAMAFCDHDGHGLVPSRTLVLGFLWDTANWFWWAERLPNVGELTKEQIQTVADSTPLGRELADSSFYSSSNWNRANVGRFISCVGVVDQDECDYQYAGEEFPTKLPQATYHIAVNDPRWLEHLKPGMEWESAAYNEDYHVEFDPAWRTSDVMALAKRINESQDCSAMPILADALQDAGCDHGDLLNHLRDTTATHVRGCWAIDLVLGKE